MERLNKWLARAGVASRRASDLMIEAGRVTVNGETVDRLGTRIDPGRDVVKLDGRRVTPPSQPGLYLMLHKPRGIVTTLSDPEGRPTIRDLLRGIRGRVFPVGRLDFQTEGLLLLTDDGELARDLMHPGKRVPKTYLAKVRGTPGEDRMDRLRQGVSLDGRKTLPATLRISRPGQNSWVEITIVEGRKHQVRRMFDCIGHPVSKLRRIRYGGVELGKLPSGRLRSLTGPEIESLRRSTEPPTGRNPKPKDRRN